MKRGWGWETAKEVWFGAVRMSNYETENPNCIWREECRLEQLTATISTFYDLPGETKRKTSANNRNKFGPTAPFLQFLKR